ncbi:MAG: hypothetical protein LBU84_20225 [Prevotella sp.]|jgi:hypothetical protein|nr:hypothetical protein [Prevotella sp.]
MAQYLYGDGPARQSITFILKETILYSDLGVNSYYYVYIQHNLLAGSFS